MVLDQTPLDGHEQDSHLAAVGAAGVIESLAVENHLIDIEAQRRLQRPPPGRVPREVSLERAVPLGQPAAVMQVQQQVNDAQMKNREMDESTRQFNEELGFKRDELSLKRAEAKAKAVNEYKKLQQTTATPTTPNKEGKKS